MAKHNGSLFLGERGVKMGWKRETFKKDFCFVPFLFLFLIFVFCFFVFCFFVWSFFLYIVFAFFVVVVGGFDMTMASPWFCSAISQFCFDLYVWNHLSQPQEDKKSDTLALLLFKRGGRVFCGNRFFFWLFFFCPSFFLLLLNTHPFLPFLFLVVDIYLGWG